MIAELQNSKFTGVERTLLSAAFDLDLLISIFKVKINVKDSGRERPLHTNLRLPYLHQSVTERPTRPHFAKRPINFIF
jgi:hypothetical protein